MGTAMLAAAVAIACLMLATWVLSVVIKNASIVDIVWGLGFVVLAWTVRLTVHGDTARQNLIVALDRKSTRLNSSHIPLSRMPSSA